MRSVPAAGSTGLPKRSTQYSGVCGYASTFDYSGGSD
jgi:hypothetical protein